MKRLFSLILCLALVLGLAVSATADTATITFKDGAADSVYTAYKLLDAKAAAGDTSFSYFVNDDFRPFWTQYAGTRPAGETDGQFGQAIVGSLSIYQNDSVEMNNLARLAYDYVQSCNDDDIPNNDISGIQSTLSELATEPTLVAEPGYYLIVETGMGANKNDTRSLYMLNTVGHNDMDIHTKESAPRVEKEVKGKNDSTNETEHYRTYADYDLGDEMEFKIVGYLSAVMVNMQTITMN